MNGSPGYVMQRNPFMPGESMEAHQERARISADAEDVLIGAIADGRYTEIDGAFSPLTQKIVALHGTRQLEMHSQWILTPQSWICPCCKRSKLEISRLSKSGRIVCKLVVHHDHMKAALEEAFRDEFIGANGHQPAQDGYDLVARMGHAWAAHDDVLVCEDCNNADSAARRHVGAPRHFTFSPTQIASFIRPRAHQPHDLNNDAVRTAWATARPAFDLRMNLISQVARAAATNSHWYEPFQGKGSSIPIAWGVLSDAGLKRLTPQMSGQNKNLTRWRTENPKISKPLPDNVVALVCSKKFVEARWNRAGENWRCQCCLRTRRESIGAANDGELSFELHSAAPANSWFQDGKSICGDCVRVLQSLKTELTERLGWRPSSSYTFVNPQQLAAIINPQPNQRHRIKIEDAARLADELEAKMQMEGPDAHRGWNVA